MPTTSTAWELKISDRRSRFFERCDRSTQAFLEVNLRMPSQQCLSERYIGAASHWVVGGRVAHLHRISNAGCFRNGCRKLAAGDFSGVSEVGDATAGLIVRRSQQD